MSAIFEGVSDNALSKLWKSYLAKPENSKKRETLRHLNLCGTGIIRGYTSAVFIVTNGKKSHVHGVNTCHNVWCCPKCSPKILSEYGTDIGCAIDALKKWHNQTAFMATFTMPHSRRMSCAESFAILQLAWRRFNKERVRYQKNGNRKDANPWATFKHDLQIKHYVRMFDFTWGEANGWHPHMHAIFWVPDSLFDKLADHEKALMNYWWHCLKLSARDVWNGDMERVEKFFTEWRKNIKGGNHRCFYISRKKDGSIRRGASSRYIAGFGADREMTSDSMSSKKAAKGHYTIPQLLSKAYQYHKVRQTKLEKKFLDLYAEVAIATKKKFRMRWSVSGIKKIILKWKETEEYFKIVKKKVTQQDQSRWRVACWFFPEQWSEICYNDTQDPFPLIESILELAKLQNGAENIYSLLELNYGMDCRANRRRHPDEDEIEKKLIINGILDGNREVVERLKERRKQRRTA